MNFREACKRYHLSEEMLWRYKENGLIVPETENEYTEEDFRYIEVIKMLSEAGMSDEMLRTYLQMLDSNTAKEEQIKLLRMFRATLIEKMHDRQRSIDHVDYLIYQTTKELQNGI